MKILTKKISKKNIFFCFMVSMSCVFFVSSEILILKKQGIINKALNKEDKDTYSQSIFSDILIRYQWPTNLLYASSMSKNEREQIFSEQSEAELKFINQKLQDIAGGYYAANVSNTVYQLFVISYFFNNPHNEIMLECFNYLFDFFYNFSLTWKEDPEEGLIPHAELTENFFDQCKAIYSEQVVVDIHFLINCELGKFLINMQTGRKDSGSEMAADLIKQIISGIKNNFSKFPKEIQDKLYNQQYDTDFSGFDSEVQTALQGELQGNTLKQNSVLRNLIAMEEEANKSNKALLMRGTPPFFQVNKLPLSTNDENRQVNNEDNELVASAVQYTNFADLRTKYSDDYLSRTVPHGIAPFIGGLYCKWDMPYNYAIKEDHYFYALLIDKKQYYENSCNNLFIIPPFGVLPQIFGQESLYHAASKVCMKYIDPTSMEFYIEGFEFTKDSAGILVIKCDPLKHAALFSQFLSQNMRLIKLPTSKGGVTLAQEEKCLKNNFRKASEFYEKVFIRDELKTLVDQPTELKTINSIINNKLHNDFEKDDYFIYKISDDLVKKYLATSR